MYSNTRKYVGCVDSFVDPMIRGVSPYLRKEFASAVYAGDSTNSSSISSNSNFIPMPIEKNKLSINLIFWWYALTFLAGIYICYSGIDIFSFSFGLAALPMSLEIFLPGAWSVSVSASCVITGLLMMITSTKMAFSNLD